MKIERSVVAEWISRIVQLCCCEQSWSAGLSPADRKKDKTLSRGYGHPPLSTTTTTTHQRQEKEAERMQLWRHDNKGWGQGVLWLIPQTQSSYEKVALEITVGVDDVKIFL